jgi:Family of unknown function (DUF6600)
MKSKIKILVLFLATVTASFIFSRQLTAQVPNISFQVFYDQLSPYGQWVDNPDWGYVWIPDAGPDFVPYSTDGHWILTNYGWTWMSDYSWGWAPFHYGRWDFDHYYGWIWIPGSEWGPAWVSWRRADGYYGWAPMEPGISLSVSFSRGYNRNDNHWIFVRDGDLDRADLNHYYISRTDQDRIGRHSSSIINTYVDSRRNATYVTGPGRGDFQKVTGIQVNPIAIQDYNRPGEEVSNGQFRMYRPDVVKNNSTERRAAPSRITSLRDVKQPLERRVTNQQRDFNPANGTEPVHQSTAVPQGNKSRSIQPQNTIRPRNIRSENQPVNSQPRNSDQPGNIRTENQPVNAQPQNIRTENQPVNAQPRNNEKPRNMQTEKQPVNAQPENANPPQNTRRGQRADNAKQDKVTNTQPKNPQNSKKEQRIQTRAARRDKAQ